MGFVCKGGQDTVFSFFFLFFVFLSPKGSHGKMVKMVCTGSSKYSGEWEKEELLLSLYHL